MREVGWSSNGIVYIAFSVLCLPCLGIYRSDVYACMYYLIDVFCSFFFCEAFFVWFSEMLVQLTARSKLHNQVDASLVMEPSQESQNIGVSARKILLKEHYLEIHLLNSMFYLCSEYLKFLIIQSDLLIIITLQWLWFRTVQCGEFVFKSF